MAYDVDHMGVMCILVQHQIAPSKKVIKSSTKANYLSLRNVGPMFYYYYFFYCLTYFLHGLLTCESDAGFAVCLLEKRRVFGAAKPQRSACLFNPRQHRCLEYDEGPLIFVQCTYCRGAWI